MIQITLLELFSRIVPESFFIIWGGYLLNNKSLNKQLCFISTIILSFSTYLIKMLPIDYGVHTIIILIMLIYILVKINKLNIIKSIYSAFIFITLLSVFELINLFVLEKILRLDIQTLFNTTLNRIMYMYPSLILFICIIIFIYTIKNNLTLKIFQKKSTSSTTK